MITATDVFHRLSSRVPYLVLREVIHRSLDEGPVRVEDLMPLVERQGLGVKRPYVRNILTGLARSGLVQWHYGPQHAKFYEPAPGVAEWLYRTEEFFESLRELGGP